MVDEGEYEAAHSVLRERVRALEALPDATKTSIKARVFADRSIDWRALRPPVSPGERRPVTWKADLVSTLLHRVFPHGGARRPRSPDGGGGDGGKRPRPTTTHPESIPPLQPQPSHPPDVLRQAEHRNSRLMCALLALLDLLSEADRNEIANHLQSSDQSSSSSNHPTQSTIAPPPGDPTARLLQRRHIQRWHGLQCFTSRVLLRRSAPSPGDGTTLRAGCQAVHAWWEAEGCYLAHFRLRPANRLTAFLPLVYTSLPAEATVDVERRALAGCHHPPSPPPMPMPPPMPDACALWRVFLNRWPVLAVYRPRWDADAAVGVLHRSADWLAEEAEEGAGAGGDQPEAVVAHAASLADVDAGLLATLAPHWFPHWNDLWRSHTHSRWQPLARHAVQAAALLRGFGSSSSDPSSSSCRAVVEAVRLAARSRSPNRSS